MNPSSDQVVSFLDSLGPKLSGILANTIDPARVVSLMEFEGYIKEFVTKSLRVAVVGGSENDPELSILGSRCAEVAYFNWREDDATWDLMADWSDGRLNGIELEYDLVLCSQVLEHVPHPGLVFSNLALLAGNGKYISLNTPALNGHHGSPNCYYAGFFPETLEILALDSGLTVLGVDAWYSKKGCRMYSICDWAALTISGGKKFKKFRQSVSLYEWLRKVKYSQTWRQLTNRHERYYSHESLFDGISDTHAVTSWIFCSKIE